MAGTTIRKSYDNINEAGKLFFEIPAALTNIYAKQFHWGYDLFNRLMEANTYTQKENSAPKSGTITNHSEAIQRIYYDYSDIILKAMASFLKYFTMQDPGFIDPRKMMEGAKAAFNLQVNYFNDLNQHTMNNMGEAIKISGEEMDELFEIFRENAASNLKLAEKETGTATKTYSFIAEKSARDTRDWLDNLNRQFEFITNSNLKLWSDLMQVSLSDGSGKNQPKNAISVEQARSYKKKNHQ